MADIKTFVDVDTRIAAGGIPRRVFGRGLALTLDSALSAGGSGKVRLFETLESAVAFFDAGSDALAAAQVWFAADPPPQGLYAGRWASTDVDTTLRAGTVPTVAATAAPLSTSNGSFVLNGTDVTVDLSSASTYADIAMAIQTAIVALGGIFAGATFVYDTDRFVLELAGSDPIANGAFSDTDSTTDTDIATALGMAASSNPAYAQGSLTETVNEALEAIVALTTSGAPVALMRADDVPLTYPGTATPTQPDIAAFAQAGPYLYGLLDTTDQALTTGDATSQAALAFTGTQGRVLPTYAQPGQRPNIAALAALSAQNLNTPGSIITLNGIALPGVQPVNVTDTQLAELQRKNTNVYTNVAGLPAFVGGTTARTGYWADAIWWLTWARNEIQLGVFNTLRASRRFTSALLNDSLLGVMERGVRNGGIMPGRTVPAAMKADIITTTGNNNFDGVLPSGYLVWIDPSPNDADLQDRIARFRIWCTGSPAIHRALGDLTFAN